MNAAASVLPRCNYRLRLQALALSNIRQRSMRSNCTCPFGKITLCIPSGASLAGLSAKPKRRGMSDSGAEPPMRSRALLRASRCSAEALLISSSKPV